jgi:signal transduction histidine kinase
MFGSRSSLPPLGLLALIVGVTVIPLATLLWLGWRLLQQDRALEAQQIQQRLDRSADMIVAALERSLSLWEQRLAAGGGVPDGAVSITIRGEVTNVTPRARVAFLPVVPTLPEPPASAFAAGDEAEYRRHDASAAIAIFRALSRSPDRATRAGGLLRLARMQQKMGQTDTALATFTALLKMDDVGIGGTPAGLVGRYARCRLLEARGRRRELESDAAALLRDLHNARWPLTAPVYSLYLADAARWTRSASETPRMHERLADAVSAFHEKWKTGLGQPGSGRDLVKAGDESIAVLWRSTSDSVIALLATPAFVREHWFTGAEDVAREQSVLLSIGNPTVTPTSPERGAPAVRSPGQTGLPWTLSIASADPGARQSEFLVRRRLLAAGFLLLVAMALAAGYLIVRAISRELAVARLQSDFVSAVSHEFRTPLTTLRQFTDMLRESAALSEERRRVCYDAQSRATDRLTRLVESLLDFGRMEAGAQPYTFEAHDLSTLVGAVVDDFRVDASAAGYDVRFRGKGAVPISVDRDAFSRALWNLLDNAVKYSPGANSVEVDVHRHERDVVVAVRDHGLGIPAGEQAAIFTKFQRGAEARSRGIKGTGLGLAMVDVIVKAHHGRIEIESEPGRGSTFSIYLPASP